MAFGSYLPDSFKLPGKWVKPSAWDRIKQDEPLDELKSEFVPDLAAIPTTVVITMSSTCTATSNFIHAQIGFTNTEPRLLGAFERAQNQGMTTAFGLNYGFRSLENEYREFPYARNTRERRILESLGKKLPETIRKAARALGAPDGSAEWNHRFFKFVSRAPARSGGTSHRRGR